MKYNTLVIDPPWPIKMTAILKRRPNMANVIVHSLQTRNPDRPTLKKNPRGGGSGHISKENETYCIDTGATQAIEQDHKIRRLTPIECERLQGFEDDWTKHGVEEDGTRIEVSDNQRYKMMGNAVTVNVVQAICQNIKDMEEHIDQ